LAVLVAAWWIPVPAASQAAAGALQAQAPAPVPSHGAGLREALDKYCVTCHNDRTKTAGLALDVLDVGAVGAHADTWEKVVAKLRSGAMPPVGLPRPDDAMMHGMVATLEGDLDAYAAAHPNPGRPLVHRMNRAEYANAIRDLLHVDVDASSLLPPDDSAFGFDNMAEILTVSPGLIERYMSAAEKISRAAIGDPTIRPVMESYRVPQNVRQEDRPNDDFSFGTRGGLAISRYFSVDGNYTVRIHMRYATGQDDLVGLTRQAVVETRVDGAIVEQFGFGKRLSLPDDVKTYGKAAVPDTYEFQIPMKAGKHVVTVDLQRETVEPEDLSPRFPTSNYSFQNDHLAPARIDFVEFGGPFDAAAIDESPSRSRIFICKPAGAGDEACARNIVSTIAKRAYRRPVAAQDVDTLMVFYRDRAKHDGFEPGIQSALERILVSPQFLFRAERPSGRTDASGIYRISDLDLASRLSFFLWSSIPDDELLDLAVRGKLHEPSVLKQQVTRMLADIRSRSLVSNFAGQWLQLRDLPVMKPDPKTFPDYDDELRDAFQTETELLFDSQLREDHSVRDLLSTNYTFVNERLAGHYGIPNVFGSHFRRVALTDPNRMGLLGQASILTVTSYGDRTSPTKRGKWVLENILGSPPPAPPPNVPALEDQPGAKFKTMRARMEQHRKNPACAGCHARIDPLGFALDNFDAVGEYRTEQGGVPIDASGMLDGVKFNGIAEVRQVLLKHQDEFVATVTKKLLTYALGRGIDYYDMPAVRHILQGAAPDDYRWSAIIVEIVESTPFQMRRSES
jgi:hypothetical protein